MGIEEDSVRALRELNQNISALTRSLGRSAGDRSFGQSTRTRSTSQRDDDDDIPRGKPRRDTQAYRNALRQVAGYDRAMRAMTKASGNLQNELVDANKDLQALREAWSDGAETMHDHKERIDRLGRTQEALNNQVTLVVAGMRRFNSEVAQNTKMQSLLYAEQLTMIDNFKTFEKAAYFDELAKSLNSLSGGAKKQLKLIDKNTGQLRSDLGVDDYRRVRATLGELDASMREALSSTDFKSFAEMMRGDAFNISPSADRDGREATDAALGNDKASINRDAVVKIAAILQARGILKPTDPSKNVLNDAGEIRSDLNNLDFKGLAQEIRMAERSIRNTTQRIDHNADLFRDSGGRLIQSLQNVEGRATAFDSMGSMLKNFFAFGAAMKFAKDKIVKAWQELSDFNIAQIPATYWEVNKASMSLGLSFQEAVKLMDENKRLLAIYGPDKFQSAMGDMQETFESYGYTMKQAASMVGPAMEAAIASGINIRDPGELNKYADNMMDQFQKLSGMVKISAEEFAALNKNLYTSEGTFETMLGMDVQRRQAYAQELVQLRTKYVAQGLEIRQAQELVLAQQQQQRGRLKDRNEDAAKLLTAAQIAGLGNEQAMQVYRLASKGRRTDDEQARLTELGGQINQGLERRIDQGYGETGAGAMGDILNDVRLDLQTSAAMQGIQKAGSQMQVSKEAGAQVEAAEQARASAAAKGNESVAALGQAINQVSSVINNAFLGAIVGSTVAVVAFGLQLSRLSMMMGGPGGLLAAIKGAGGGILGEIGKRAGPIAGRIGGAAGAAGGAIRGAAGAAGGAIGANAGVLGKALGVLGAGIMAFQAWGDVNEAEEQKNRGEITEKEATVKKAGAVGGAVGGIGAGIAGAAIGQVLIPIPGVGAVVGGAVGAALGSWLGKSGAEAVTDAVVSDKKEEAHVKKEDAAKMAASVSTAVQSVSQTSGISQGNPTQVSQKLPSQIGGVGTAFAATPITPPTPQIGIESTKDGGINTITQDGEEKVFNVHDPDSFNKLQDIAASMTKAVEFLQQMAEAGILPAKSSNSLPPPNNMNQIPTAYQFTTGKV